MKNIGTFVENYEIIQILGAGKSATVYLGQYKTQKVAIKIFNIEIIERQGWEIQEERLLNELSLIGKDVDNVIKILGGKCCKESDRVYLIMEYLDYRTLADLISEFPDNQIVPVIKEVAKAAYNLEKLGIYHRDIKPENIMVSSNYDRVKLCDLGVMKPVSRANITDIDGTPFIGTLRYASPEFLTRTETQDDDGYRAITFYQIGAVLHDLIMKKPIFYEYSEPYIVLGNAVQQTIPNIENKNLDQKIIDICNLCLQKDPKNRLRLLNWDDLLNIDLKYERDKEIFDDLFRKKEVRQLNSNMNLQQEISISRYIELINGEVRNICQKTNKEVRHSYKQDIESDCGKFIVIVNLGSCFQKMIKLVFKIDCSRLNDMFVVLFGSVRCEEHNNFESEIEPNTVIYSSSKSVVEDQCIKNIVRETYLNEIRSYLQQEGE